MIIVQIHQRSSEDAQNNKNTQNNNHQPKQEKHDPQLENKEQGTPPGRDHQRETTPLPQSTCKIKKHKEDPWNQVGKDEAKKNPPKPPTTPGPPPQKPYHCQQRTGCTSHS